MRQLADARINGDETTIKKWNSECGKQISEKLNQIHQTQLPIEDQKRIKGPTHKTKKEK